MDEMRGGRHSETWRLLLACALTFTAGEGMAPLSFVLALEHRLPHQVEAGITGQLHLRSRAHLHGGGVQVGHGVFYLGAVWRGALHVVSVISYLK